MGKPWKFDEEGFQKRIAHLDEYQRLEIMKSALDYRLDAIEKGVAQLDIDIKNLEEQIYRINDEYSDDTENP